jgi:hypothetical protein
VAKVLLTLEERLLSKLEFDPNSGCWLWSGSGVDGGYGRISSGGRRGTPMVLTHRAAYTIWIGPLSSEVDVLHRCDTPPCCNPAHLFLGNDFTNCADKIAKGRGKRSSVRTVWLNEEKAIEIRRAVSAGGQSGLAFARQFGISRQHLRAIIERRIWKDAG